MTFVTADSFGSKRTKHQPKPKEEAKYKIIKVLSQISKAQNSILLEEFSPMSKKSPPNGALNNDFYSCHSVSAKNVCMSTDSIQM